MEMQASWMFGTCFGSTVPVSAYRTVSLARLLDILAASPVSPASPTKASTVTATLASYSVPIAWDDSVVLPIWSGDGINGPEAALSNSVGSLPTQQNSWGYDHYLVNSSSVSEGLIAQFCVGIKQAIV